MRELIRKSKSTNKMLETPKSTTATTTATNDVITQAKNSNSKAESADNIISASKSATSTATTTSSIYKHKLKSSNFNWFKSSSIESDSVNRNIENRYSAPPNCQIQRPTKTFNEISYFRDYCGVQTLKNLWNKRINANAEALRLEGSNGGGGSSNSSKGKRTKSVSCLVRQSNEKDINNSLSIKECVESFEFFQRQPKNRARSLHDCRSIGTGIDIATNDIETQKKSTENKIDSLNRLKDNFYKYKTAEQATAHLLREAHSRAAKTKSASATGTNRCGIDNTSMCGTVNGGSSNVYEFTKSHIDWLKNHHDKNIAKHRTLSNENYNLNSIKSTDIDIAFEDKKAQTRTKTTATTTAAGMAPTLSKMNDDINCCGNTQQILSKNFNLENDAPNITEPTKECNQCCRSGAPASSLNETITTVSNELSSCIIPPVEKASTSTAGTSRCSTHGTVVHNNNKQHQRTEGNERNERTSGNSSPSLSTGSRSKKKKAQRSTSNSSGNSSSNVRKYSFKTHSRPFITPRKMHGHKNGNGGTAANNTNITGSVVAKLTQQFNEMIQKDKTILKEIKRKNCVLLTRGCHVYKVIEVNDSHHQQQQLKRNNSNASSVMSQTSLHPDSKDATIASTPPIQTDSSPYASVVKKTIKKFELNSESAKHLQQARCTSQRKKNCCRNNHQQQQNTANSACSSVHSAADKEENNQSAKNVVKRCNLSLPLTVVVHQHQQENDDIVESQATLTLKKQTHATLFSPQTLEVVKEEDRTPLGNDDRTLLLPPEESNENKNENERETKAASAADSAASSVNTDFPNDQKQNDPLETPYTPLIIKNYVELEPKSIENVTTTSQRCRKKCSKIYEKLRLFSPFDNAAAAAAAAANSNSKMLSLMTSNSTSSISSTPPMLTPITPKEQHFQQTSNDDSGDRAVSKLYEALQQCNEKIKEAVDLATKNTVPLSKDTPPNAEFTGDEDMVEKLILPNSSFIHQACVKQVGNNNQLIVPQAVNVSLINSIEGEQMIMEQKELQMNTNAGAGVGLIEEIMSNKYDDTIYELISSDEKTDSCDENVRKSFLYSSSQQKKTLSQTIEDIYQTVDEVQQQKQQQQEQQKQQQTKSTENRYSPNNSLNDYESIAGSCEHATGAGLPINSIPTTLVAAKLIEDGYEVCDPPKTDSSMLSTSTSIMTMSTTTTTSTTTAMVRNTNDDLPELPKPERILPNSSVCKRLQPTRPLTRPAVIAAELPNRDIDEQICSDDGENIYDTIKGSHCYESLNANNQNINNNNNNNSNNKRLSMTYSIGKSNFENLSTAAAADSVSLSSNCYESITHYRRIVLSSNCSGGVGGYTAGSSNGSTLTISSDHKTNSLYEAPLPAELLYSGFRNKSARISSSIYGLSTDRGSNRNSYDGQKNADNDNFSESLAISSDNSDEWIDMSESDTEGGGAGDGGSGNADGKHQQFIVVRERHKAHCSPAWSRRVREKRLQITKSEIYIEDDSDHYYETLTPLGGKRHSTQLPTIVPLAYSSTNEIDLNEQREHNRKYNSNGAEVSDDYDSFDSSIDDLFDSGQSALQRDHNDSGVDIRNVILPEPPPTTNQVYAIVRKLKKLITNKKSPAASSAESSSKSNSNHSQQKLYESSSQFYVEENTYRNTPKSKSVMKLMPNTKLDYMPSSPIHQEEYENVEFHAHSGAHTSTTKGSSNSEKNLSGSRVYQPNQLKNNSSAESATLRSISKSGKFLKSRIQRNLGGSSNETKNNSSSASALQSTRSTFYIEDPSIRVNCGELDSGFSERASSNDPQNANDFRTLESQKSLTVLRKSKRENKSTQRRRTVIGLRPNDPPPPPPDDAMLNSKSKHQKSSTSWYAECGVFKNGHTLSTETPLPDKDALSSNNKNTLNNQNCSSPTSSSSNWYAEAGLYQTSGISEASFSGSSGVSTGNEAGGPGDENMHIFFMNEPLYQIYNAAKLESISRDMKDNDSSTDGYEEIGQNANAAAKRIEDRQRRPRLSALQLVGPKVGPARTLWSEIPEVINSCVLITLTPRERALQEAKFEILTSEASYLKSLNLLRSHFMNHPIFRDTNIVSSHDRKALFSNIVPVHECSEKLLTELESCWQDNIMLLGLSERIYSIAEKSFHVYITFCEHQGRMDRTLRRLKDTKGIFCQNLELLESSPTCCGLNLHSFLMLPMQRITRLPLLIDAVFSKVSPDDDEYDSWKMTLAIMNKIVAQCNEAANRCEQAYEIERISRQLEFPPTIRPLAIAPLPASAAPLAPGSKPRYLVKKGELTHLVWRVDDAKLTFGRKITKSAIYAFLFSDLLVLAKRKSEDQFTVFDYCPRNMLTISSGKVLPQLPTKDLNQTGKNLILMTLLENYEQKTVELVLSCPSVSEQERWLQTMRLPQSETPGEKLYEEWDCPQVIAKHEYKPNEPDALTLDEGDVVNVMRKLPDGWYQGERIRDGATGWFPGSYTEEVNSAHVRARNLKQRHRLLTFTATYLESRKQK